jgi:hypothetical protein
MHDQIGYTRNTRVKGGNGHLYLTAQIAVRLIVDLFVLEDVIRNEVAETSERGDAL